MDCFYAFKCAEVYVSAALPFLSAYARLVTLNVVAQRVVYFNLTPHKRFWLAVLRVAVNSGSFIQAFSLAPCSALASVFLRVFLPRSA